MVVDGTVTVSLEGGILGNESHLEFAHETLRHGDVAYIPNGRAYWFREATGKQSAETINVFNVGRDEVKRLRGLSRLIYLDLLELDYEFNCILARKQGHGM